MSDLNTDAGGREPEDMGGVASWLGGVFVDPAGTFKAIAARASVPRPADPSRTRDATKWWVPVVIMAAISVLVVVFVVVPYVAGPAQEEAVREAVIEQGGTEAQVQEIVEQSAPFIMPFAILGGLLQAVVLVFIVAGVAHLLMKMLGGKGMFRHARAVVSYSMLVSVLGTIVKLPFMIRKESLYGAETGLVIFFKNLEPSDRLYNFLFSGFDVFTLWWVVVLGIGLTAAYKTPKAKGYVAAGIIWLLFSLVSMFQQGGG